MKGYETFQLLKKLCYKAGATHYERIAMAAQCLADKEWVSDPTQGGGDENKALDRLESQCFGDLCGAISLPQLLELYHNVPDVEKWRAQHFNLKKIWAEWKSRQGATKRKASSAHSNGHQASPRRFVEPLGFAQLPPAKAREEYERTYRAVENSAQKIERLEAENTRLKEENTALKQELQRFKTKTRELLQTA